MGLPVATRRSPLRTAHAFIAWLVVAAIVAQAFLAGAAIGKLGGSNDFTLHREFGYTAIGLLVLAVLVTAIASDVPRRWIGTAFGLLVLYVVQISLPELRDSAPSVAALHPLNAMILFSLATWYGRVAWRERRLGPREPAVL